uniref:Retrotransposon protein, putative, unclassified n=2 Tax=Oryza sativa subsp. japonica TaxID=39947 RepID=Q2R9R9_ORYSJ|nr:retrotransposon protein, putative, unclassified [Oryza sativa Japonica Group]ABA91784.1 retrotransposon protein, putative, unclassified [Oryza sativa Japonica Group]
MATPARFSTKPHVFDGTDFSHWCSRMQFYIMAEDYDIWRKVSHPYVIPEAINTAAEKTAFEQNCKARNILLSGISRSDYDRVAHLQTVHEIWTTLSNFHQGTNNIKELRRDLFKKEYIKFEMKPGEALDDYLSQFNKILSNLRSVDSSCDANYPQSEISRHFLNGLDMSIWEMKVTSIQESVNMSTLTLNSLYTKLKTHEMDVLSRKVDSKSSALVFSSSSLDVDASSSKPSFLAVFNATSDDQLEQIEEENLALVANRIARAMNNARNRKRAWERQKEDKDGEKTNNNNKPKGSYQGRKMENLRKAFQQVCAAFEPLSDVDGESGDDDKGKNISDVCFMARGESDTEYEDNEVLMNEISKIRDINAAHDLKNRYSLACSFALHTRTLDELFLTKKLLQKYRIAFHASLMFNMISAKKLKQPHDVLDCSTCNLNKLKSKDALGRVEYMEDVVKNNEVLSCPKCRKSKGVMVDCENCANLEKEVSYLKNSLLRFSDGKKNLNMILDQSKALVARKENVWIVDSGCSRHMTGDKNWFSSLKKASKTESIIFGDAATSAVLATGMVKVNEKFELKNVALVEYLKYNLLSVSQNVDENFEVHFKKTGSKVFDSCGDSMLNISRYGRVFKADFENPVSPVITCLVAKFDKDVMFWHRRLGHVGFDHLTRLSGLDLVCGLPKPKKDLDLVCTPCRHAKMVASSHAPIVSVMTDAPGQLLHMDTIGPARVQSVGGKWYVLVIVDDFSRYSWVFFMATKDEAFQHFRGLFLRLELEFPGSLKRIRSDNGGEFKNASFEQFYNERGLEHEFSSPHVPQQNGVVERKNRVLVEMARTILNEYKTPRKFWAEAINTACYISNRVFLRSKLGKTSYELRFGHQPKVSHLHVFGCKCFVLKSGNLDKFVGRSTDGLLLGYPAHTHGYRVLILETNKIVETCEVSFDEASPDESDDNDDDEVGSAGQTGRQAGQTAGTPPVRPAQDVWSDRPGSLGSGTVDADRDGPLEITTSTSTDTERGSTSEVAAPLHIQRRHPPEQIIGNIGERTTRSKEEVYVKQPPGFENPDFPNHVFKLSKALYGLKQAPRAWYDRLKNFLLAKGFTMGKVDKTLFVLKHGDNQLFVQIYVDDIIFGCSTHALVVDFAETMRREFEMSMMGELSYFLGLQIKQTPQGTFVHQTKYTKDLLRRFKMENCKPISTPIGSTAVLGPDEDGEAVDQKEYRSMIGSLLYLTASRPDIQFAVCLCARFQASPRASHRQAVKRIMSAINIAKNPVQYSRTKHIDIRFHFLRDHVEKGDVELQFLDTKLQLADIFTKPLDSNRFAFLRGELGIIHPFGMV